MLELVTGNLLEADTEALVNTVNIEGVMGKGIWDQEYCLACVGLWQRRS